MSKPKINTTKIHQNILKLDRMRLASDDLEKVVDYLGESLEDLSKEEQAVLEGLQDRLYDQIRKLEKESIKINNSL